MSNNIGIQIVKFWTNYKPGKDGKPIGVDMVMYGPIGRVDKQATVATVASLGRLQPLDEGDRNLAIQMAHARWARIEPAYKAWKEGREAPATGTPLGSWPQLSEDQVQGLHMIGVRSVEDVAQASESIVQRFPFSNAREIQKSAQLFLQAFDKQKVAQDMSQLHNENAVLKEQLEEMRVMFLEMKNAQPVAEEAPRRRGRQPSAAAEEAAA